MIVRSGDLGYVACCRVLNLQGKGRHRRPQRWYCEPRTPLCKQSSLLAGTPRVLTGVLGCFPWLPEVSESSLALCYVLLTFSASNIGMRVSGVKASTSLNSS